MGRPRVSPVAFHNDSVSREHLAVNFHQDGIKLQNLSDGSRTRIRTVATQEHKSVIRKNEAARLTEITPSVRPGLKRVGRTAVRALGK